MFEIIFLVSTLTLRVVSREHKGSAPVSAPGSRASSVPPTGALPQAPSARESPYIMASLNPALVNHPRPFSASPHRAELEEEKHLVTEQVSGVCIYRLRQDRSKHRD